ncbi:flippase [Pedobacter antarcticus]|uniref:flippase n=1 Tax=Pedobacter antarcticus TaxID=34086 RepID=UPI00292F3485|nr:flippase [Pedobacter antarcticus]
MEKRTFLKDLLSVFSSKAASLLLGLVTSILTARYLGPEGNGVIAALSIYPSLFMALGALGIQQSTTYFVGQNKYSVSDIYNSVLAIWLITSTLGISVSYLLIKYFAKENFSNDLIILAVIAIPFSLYTTYTSGIFLGMQNIKEFNRINWIPALTNAILTFVLIGLFPFGVKGSMIAIFLGVFILTFIVFIKIRKYTDVRIRFNWIIIKDLFKLGAIYAFTTLIASLNYKVDIILLEKWSNVYELGIYSKGAVLVELMWQVPVILSTIIFSRSAAAKDSKLFSIKVCQLLRFTIIIIVGISVIFFIMSGFIINTLYGEKFAHSAEVIRMLIPGVMLMVLYKVLYMDMAGRGRPWMSMEAMIPAVILNVILNYFLVPKYGAVGSSIASTISYSLSAIVFVVRYSQYTGISLRSIFTYTADDWHTFKRAVESVKTKLVR